MEVESRLLFLPSCTSRLSSGKLVVLLNGKEKRFGTQCHSLFNSPFHRSPMRLESSLLLLAWVSSILTFVSTGKIRRRRDLLDLADMFDVLTGLDPTDYIPYGNWCGYGGQGKPIDRIDECCKVHDHCYGASEKECSNVQVHIVQYAWKMNNETVICEDESICEFSVCKCDKDVVECIAQHNHTYSEHYRFIRKFR